MPESFTIFPGRNPFQLVFLAEQLLVLLLASLLFIIYIWKKRPNGWLKPFGPDYQLKIIIRGAIAATLSRWWVLALPLALKLTYQYQFTFLDWTSIRLSVDSKLKREELCRSLDKYLADDNLFSSDVLVDKISKEISSSLEFPSELWNLYLGPVLGIVIAIAILIWFERTRRKNNIISSESNSMLISGFRLALVSFTIVTICISMGSIWFLSFYNIKPLDRILFILPILLITPGIASILSVWFSAIYQKGSNFQQEFNQIESDQCDKQISFINLVLIVFLPVIFIVCIKELLSFLEMWSPFSNTYYMWKILETLDVIISWCLFPLPFLVARHLLGLRDGFKLLYQTWRHHFRRLITLAILIVATDSIGDVIRTTYYTAMPSSPTTFEECMNLWFAPDPIGVIITILNVFLGMTAFMIVVISFQSGALDLPEDKGEREEKDMEEVGE